MTVWEVAGGDVVAGAAGGVFAGALVGIGLPGEVPLDVVGAVTLGSAVPLVGPPGGEVARGGGSAVTVCEVVGGDVVAGAAGGMFAGALLGVGLLDEVPLGVVGAVTLGSVVPLVAGPGGEVARGGGQAGSKELADNSRSCPIASSRVPAGSPA